MSLTIRPKEERGMVPVRSQNVALNHSRISWKEIRGISPGRRPSLKADLFSSKKRVGRRGEKGKWEEKSRADRGEEISEYLKKCSGTPTLS